MSTRTLPLLNTSNLSNAFIKQFLTHWKNLSRNRAITARDAALRILVLNQDPLKSMAPTKKPGRIASGALQDSGLHRAMLSLWNNLSFLEINDQTLQENERLILKERIRVLKEDGVV